MSLSFSRKFSKQKSTSGRIAIVLVALLAGLTACLKEPGPTWPTVAEKYRFAGGDWKDVKNAAVPNAVSALGESTFTVSGKGVSIFYTDVYTTDDKAFPTGGVFDGDIWTYLYAGNIKIGVIIYTADKIFYVYLGKTFISSTDIKNYVYIRDMQNAYNGYAYPKGQADRLNSVAAEFPAFRRPPDAGAFPREPPR
ncbi:MAG: hypothetical protein FWD94_08520 [Treponema sp.]|nr:hypothetical protein [Treponema sp.]